MHHKPYKLNTFLLCSQMFTKELVTNYADFIPRLNKHRKLHIESKDLSKIVQIVAQIFGEWFITVPFPGLPRVPVGSAAADGYLMHDGTNLLWSAAARHAQILLGHLGETPWEDWSTPMAHPLKIKHAYTHPFYDLTYVEIPEINNVGSDCFDCWISNNGRL